MVAYFVFVHDLLWNPRRYPADSVSDSTRQRHDQFVLLVAKRICCNCSGVPMNNPSGYRRYCSIWL